MELFAQWCVGGRPHLGDRLAVPGDDDAFSALNTFDELREMGLGLVNSNFQVDTQTSLVSDQTRSNSPRAKDVIGTRYSLAAC